jgi:hypothetical protein
MSESMLKQSEGSTLNEAIRLVGQGDSEAFADIYRTYAKLVHRICLRMLRDPAEARTLLKRYSNAVLIRFRRNKRFWMLLSNRRQDYTDPNCELHSRKFWAPSGTCFIFCVTN